MSSQKLVGKALGLLMAHQLLATGMTQTTEWLRCPSKPSFGDGSSMETFDGIIECNVLQQSFLQKTILIVLNQTKAPPAPCQMWPLAARIGYTSFPQTYGELPPCPSHSSPSEFAHGRALLVFLSLAGQRFPPGWVLQPPDPIKIHAMAPVGQATWGSSLGPPCCRR